jgi:hypothetical protein
MFEKSSEKKPTKKYFNSSSVVYNNEKVRSDQLAFSYQNDLKKFSSLILNSLDELKYRQSSYTDGLFNSSFYVVDTILPIVNNNDEKDPENKSLYIDTYYYHTGSTTHTKF